MQNGFLYEVFRFIIGKLCIFNIVEYFKKFGIWLNPNKADKDKSRMYERVATDIFIVLKWLFIIIVWTKGWTNVFIVIITWYLIISNLFTYFFHHIWTDEALNTSNFKPDRVRRRFINLLLAVAFSNLSFAYFYQEPYSTDFNWGPSGISTFHSIWYSISNSVAANYDVVKPINDIGNNVSMIQLMIMFIFVTIIISRSIPQTTK